MVVTNHLIGHSFLGMSVFLLGILRTCTCSLPLGSGAFGRAEQARLHQLRPRIVIVHLDDQAASRACTMEREATAVAAVGMRLPQLAPRHRLQTSAALVSWMVLRPVV